MRGECDDGHLRYANGFERRAPKRGRAFESSDHADTSTRPPRAGLRTVETIEAREGFTHLRLKMHVGSEIVEGPALARTHHVEFETSQSRADEEKSSRGSPISMSSWSRVCSPQKRSTAQPAATYLRAPTHASRAATSSGDHGGHRALDSSRSPPRGGRFLTAPVSPVSRASRDHDTLPGPGHFLSPTT